MTVSYSRDVFTSTGHVGIFLKLLARWKGSIYKLIWHDLLVYVTLYILLSCLYRFGLSPDQRVVFELVSLHCSNYGNLIPVTFVLGFYVSVIITRWWAQFELLPWPDSASVWVSSCVHGHDDRGRLMRRTIVRYLNLSLILTLRLVSLPVKKRFPTLEHLVETGILLQSEKSIIEKMDLLSMNHPKYWMPLVWAGSIVTRARKEQRVVDDYAKTRLIQKIDEYRTLCGGLLNYDWVQIPLVYTQVVTLAVYSFLLSTLMARQFLDPEKGYEGHDVDLVVPIFTFLQFFFYMGWLKVAEALINPFGEDDDDFDTNWLIDRNLQVSYLIVDEMHLEHPELIKDQFWDDVFPELPYTQAAEDTRNEPIIGATTTVEIPLDEGEFLPMNDTDEYASQISGQSPRKLKKGALVDLEEGLIIDVPEEIKTQIGSNNKLDSIASKLRLPQVASTITFRTEHGSNSSLGKASSIISTMMNKLRPSRLNLHRDESNRLFVMGSNSSLASRENSRRVRRRSRRKQQLARSVSRISGTSDPQSPRRSSTTTSIQRGFLHSKASAARMVVGDPSMSRTSSISSSHSNILSESESEHNCSKQEINDILKKDLKTFKGQQPQQSSSPPRPKFADPSDSIKVRRGMVIAHNEELQNQMLKQKMEMIQNLQQDIMTMLDPDTENVASTMGDDPSDLVKALEIRTELMKKQMMRRNKPRSRTTSATYSTHDDLNKSLNCESCPAPDDDDLANEFFHAAHRKASMIPSVDTETVTEDPLENNEEEMETKKMLAQEEDLSSLGKESLKGDSQEDEEDAHEDSNGSESPGDNTFDLSTIEEQPEYGDQSDSSDTEMLLPTKIKPSEQNLPTLHEEEHPVNDSQESLTHN